MMRRYFLRKSLRHLQNPRPLHSSTDSQVEFTWTPELFGPVFETKKITIWQALRNHLIEQRTKIMASFVPDELIYTVDLTKKYLNTFHGVVLLIDISSCHELWQEFRFMRNDGSYGMNKLFNTQMRSIIEEIYLSNGDVINFESHGIMAVWKVRKPELIFKTVELVIKCALKFQDTKDNFNYNLHTGIKLTITISTGEVGFSVIGNENGRHWVLIGQPVEDVRRLIKNCNGGDIILSDSAWEYVSPNNYEHVVMDMNNIKVISEIRSESRLRRKSISLMKRKKLPTKISIKGKGKREPFIKHSFNLLASDQVDKSHQKPCVRSSLMVAASRKLEKILKSFITPALLNHIEKDRLLEDIHHNRRVTILSITIVPVKCNNSELLNLSDECFTNLLRLVEGYSGRIESVMAHSNSIFFSTIFGPLAGDTVNEYTNGVICAEKCLKVLNNIGRIKNLSIGVSTGVVLYTIVGDSIRHAYFCLGLPVEKSEKIATISNQKVCCDLDTVLYSNISRNCFRLRTIKGTTGFKKFHIYEFHNSEWSERDHWINRKIHEVYPIIGRFDDLEKFTDALDDICSSERNHCGFLIQGPERIGKSRLLDECILIARSRQISIHRLALNSCDSSRSFSAIHQVLMNILNADPYETIKKREKMCIKNFGRLSSSKKFCYINAIMHVNFSFTKNYLIENEKRRVTKALQLFNDFLESIRQPTCIFLDDAHLIDEKSWPFIYNILNHKNFFLTMTVNSMKPTSSQNNCLNDSRLYKCTLGGLKADELCPLVCQFLDVNGISKNFFDILTQRSENHPGWCEILISLMLERKWLDFQYPSGKRNIKDLISPPIESIAKVPYGVFPDEINHDLPHYKRHIVTLNPQSELFINNHTSLSIVELYRNIFSFLPTYEQNLLKTAAVLGNVFLRDTLETVMPNSIEFQTATAITRLIEFRIIECASVQRFNYNISPYVNRSTFSDMHHLFHCSCYRTKDASKEAVKKNQSDLPGYSHCKLLEFKMRDFRDFVYKQIAPSQRKYLHTIVAEVYERQAKRCDSCGGGSFFKTPSASQQTVASRRGSIIRQTMSRQFTKFRRKRRSLLDGSQEAHNVAGDRKTLIRDNIDAEQTVIIAERNKRKRGKIFDVNNDPSQRVQLNKFNMIDFRNCECEKIIIEINMELMRHLEELNDPSRFVKWAIETAAGLIQICRCTEAVKLLASAKKPNDNLSPKERWANTLNILELMGDASAALGKNSNAKNYYRDIIRLQKDIIFLNKSHRISNKINRCWHQTFNRNIRDILSIKLSRNISKRLTVAHYLMKLSKVYLSQGDTNYAESTALNSFNIGFSCPHEGFIEKCNIYTNATIIFRTMRKWKFVRHFEREMLLVLRKKHRWLNIDEILSAVHVFQLMFELRTLRGENEDAYNIGIKILKISGTLHLTGVTLIILPLLIQLAVRMKRIYQTADLMGLLYYLSVEDIDDSSITWYYSLSLDLALDAGMALEPFEKSLEHAKTILNCKYRTCVSRDPECLNRLLTCLWIWQLRMGVTVTAIFPQSSTIYTDNIKFDSHSQILTLAKGLGCYLLVLRRHIDIRNSVELPDLLRNISLLLETLEILSKNARFIKSRLFMLKAYLKIMHGDKYMAMKLLKRGRKHAVIQGNQMMLAWIQQTEMTFKMQQYNNMAQHWAEHSSSVDDFNWRNIHDFDVKAWSAVLYPIPVPESCF